MLRRGVHLLISEGSNSLENDVSPGRLPKSGVENDGKGAHPSFSRVNTTWVKLSKALRVEWVGQTAASLFWISSVLAYGINSHGDWLQLFAASSWLIANIATIVTPGGS